MGRGIHSKGLRQTRRSMARGRIRGTTIAEKGHRVTARDVKKRRERNIDVALNGTKPDIVKFEAQRRKWLSDTDTQRKVKYEELGIYNSIEEEESIIADYLKWMEEEANKES